MRLALYVHVRVDSAVTLFKLKASVLICAPSTPAAHGIGASARCACGTADAMQARAGVAQGEGAHVGDDDKVHEHNGVHPLPDNRRRSYHRGAAECARQRRVRAPGGGGSGGGVSNAMCWLGRPHRAARERKEHEPSPSRVRRIAERVDGNLGAFAPERVL